MGPRSDWAKAIEISDLLVDVDPETRVRRPIRSADIEAALAAPGDRWGVRLARRLPATDGVLDDDAIDRLLIAVHSELSRLGQELAQPERLRAILVPLLDAIRASGHDGPIRVVDLGCGAGYTTRWLTRHGRLGADVDLAGCDYNAALIGEARRLAALEGLRCTFELDNAFALRDPATVITSSGVLHHFRGDGLRAFFANHDPTSVRAFVHYDVTPSSPFVRWLGAWVFHLARMRVGLSRHDGVISAMRAHDDATLIGAAQAGAPWSTAGIYDPAGTRSILMNVMRPVIGLEPDLADRFVAGLERRADRFVVAGAAR